MLRLLAVAAALAATLAWTAGCDVDCEICCTDYDQTKVCFTMEQVDKGTCEDCDFKSEFEQKVEVTNCSCEGK